MTDMQMRTLQPEGQVPLTNVTPQSLRKSNKETRRQRYLKRSERELARDQKGEHHQAPSIHSQEKKKKAAKD